MGKRPGKYIQKHPPSIPMASALTILDLTSWRQPCPPLHLLQGGGGFGRQKPQKRGSLGTCLNACVPGCMLYMGKCTLIVSGYLLDMRFMCTLCSRITMIERVVISLFSWLCAPPMCVDPSGLSLDMDLMGGGGFGRQKPVQRISPGRCMKACWCACQ